ncbi:hypothetical protein D3C75_853650 [compost metagenome]
MGVLQGGPLSAQLVGIDFPVRTRGFGGWQRLQVQFDALFFGTETFNQRRPGGFFAGGGEEHLVHGGALAVENLDAALRSACSVFVDGKHTGPATEEQAQVDVR